MCRDCARADSLARYHERMKNPEFRLAEQARNRTVQREEQRRANWAERGAIGFSVGDFAAMKEAQGGRCAICRKPPAGRSLCVDHDHATGRVRALLCTKCNTLLGMADDNPAVLAAAIDYLSTQAWKAT